MADLKISQLTSATTPLAGTEVAPIVQSSTTKKVSIANLTAGRSVGMQQANIAAAAGGGIGNPAWVADDGTGAMRLAFLAAPYAGVPAGKPWLHSYQDIYIGSDAGITVNFVSGGTTVSFDSGNLKPAAAKGVNFTANTPAAGMTSQLLNWYEEGTWTPTLAYSVSDGDLNYTAGYRNGTYTRVGRLVTVNFYVLFNETTASGNLTLTNLPFVTANLTNIINGGGMYVDNMTGFTGAPTWQISQNGGTVMSFWDSAAGTAVALSNTNTAAANNVIRVIAQYFTA